MPLESVPASRDEQLAALLAAPPPREVPAAMRRAATRQAPGLALGVFGALFAGMGLLFVWMFFPWNFLKDAQLAAAGTATAEGTVVAAGRTGMSINKQRVYRYEFSFRSSGGAPVRGVCYTTGMRWQAGESAPVRYRPENPALCCLAGARLSQGNAAALPVLVFPAVGGGVIAWVLVARRRVRALLTHGAVAEALVTGVERTSVQVNRQYIHRITLQPTDAAMGRPFVLRKYQPAEIEFARQRLESKQPVFVLYDPAHPRRALLPESL